MIIGIQRMITHLMLVNVTCKTHRVRNEEERIRFEAIYKLANDVLPDLEKIRNKLMVSSVAIQIPQLEEGPTYDE